MKPFRVVVVGCGGMANRWIEYAMERRDVEIAALCDIRREVAEAKANQFHLQCPTFTDVEEAITRTEANLVFDVTIPETHAQVVTTALRLGCHVMGEKPLATSLPEAEMVIQTARACGRTYAVMQNRRYNRNIRALRELIANGTIGQVGMVCADFFLGPHFGGFRDDMDSPLIVDMAIHTFDQARFLTGADAVSVYCHEFNPPGSWYKGNAAAICIFEMSDGSVFCYRGSWCAEGAPTSWEASWRITGSRGTAIWDGHTAPYADVIRPSTPAAFLRATEHVEAEFTWPGREGHAGCLDEMFAALQEGRAAETDCHDNFKSIAMVFAALESAKSGKKVPCAGLL
ncbi:Gfo/Idh/MocA family protein [Alicyclobacillus herbarius]|uniref:Gfo/Idh/MocA family protein n=1 Tax=Alicyclobacillus herbarius TaxID=122960 RepID=UPI0004249281|nr:Gfo/Idh/MocA family oxidoreductase [Alicyclobacillus herbarius]